MLFSVYVCSLAHSHASMLSAYMSKKNVDGGEKAPLGSWFPLSTVWIQQIKLTVSGLATSNFTC